MTVIVYNYATGSDTQASGAGPAIAITGSTLYTGDGVGGGSMILFTLSGDNPDLSGVTEWSNPYYYDAIWVDSPSGQRHIFEIKTVDNTAKTITVRTQADFSHIFAATGANWAIGGKRKTYFADPLRVDTADATDNMTFHFEDEQPLSTVPMTFTGSFTSYKLPIVISGESYGVSSIGATGTNHLIQTFTNMYITVQNLTLKSDGARHAISMTNNSPAAIYVNNCYFTRNNSTTTSCDGINTNTNTRGAINNCFFFGLRYPVAISGGRQHFSINNCVFSGNTYGFYTNGGTSLSHISIRNSIFHNNSQGHINILSGYLDKITIDHCTFDTTANFPILVPGIDYSGWTPDDNLMTITNSIISNSGSYGIVAWGEANLLCINNAFYANSSGSFNNESKVTQIGSITLTADPYTDQTNDDFTLNNTAGGGASCRGAALDASQTYLGVTGSSDIGALQSQPPTSGSAGGPFIFSF